MTKLQMRTGQTARMQMRSAEKPKCEAPERRQSKTIGLRKLNAIPITHFANVLAFPRPSYFLPMSVLQGQRLRVQSLSQHCCSSVYAFSALQRFELASCGLAA